MPGSNCLYLGGTILIVTGWRCLNTRCHGAGHFSSWLLDGRVEEDQAEAGVEEGLNHSLGHWKEPNTPGGEMVGVGGKH